MHYEASSYPPVVRIDYESGRYAVIELIFGCFVCFSHAYMISMHRVLLAAPVPCSYADQATLYNIDARIV